MVAQNVHNCATSDINAVALFGVDAPVSIGTEIPGEELFAIVADFCGRVARRVFRGSAIQGIGGYISKMKAKILVLAAGLLAFAGLSSAAVIGSTDPTQFTNVVDWCQLGCPGGTALATPGTFTAVLGDSGFVGLFGTGQPFYIIQQGQNLFGDFPNGMGAVYNGAVPDDIATQFNQAEQGFGAYIETDLTGAFTATITLYDQNDLVVGSYTTAGVSVGLGNNPLFIGAFDSTADVWAASFQAFDSNQNEDFYIGEAGFYAPAASTPEPGTMLMLAPALLGLAAYGRKRFSSR